MALYRSLTSNVKRSLALVVAFGVAALCGSSDAYAAGVPGPDDASSNESAVAGKSIFKTWGKPVVLDHFMIDVADLGEIIPCVKVLRGLYTAAQNNPNLYIRVSVSYYSNGTERSRVLIAPLRDYLKTTHHGQATQQPGSRYLLVDNTFDVGEPVDEGSTVTGSAELVIASAPATR